MASNIQLKLLLRNKYTYKKKNIMNVGVLKTAQNNK